MSRPIEKILETIRRLAAQEAGEREAGNIGAAESFAEKLQELLTKHKLSLDDVSRIKENDNNPLTYELINSTLWGEYEKDARVEETEELAAILCRAYFCRILVIKESNNLIIVGRKSDIEIAKYVMATVIKAAYINCEIDLALAIAHLSLVEGGIENWQNSGGNKEFKFSFFSGFNGRVNDRLEERKRNLERGAGATQALSKWREEVDDFVKTLTPENLPPPTERQIMMSQAYHRGMDHGSNVPLSPGLTSNLKEIGD